jgi:signal peptidase I
MPELAQAPPESAPPKSDPRRTSTLLSAWLRDLAIGLSILAFAIVFLYTPVRVEGTSMMPSLSDQEHIFINRFVYRIEPIHHGDIIVFRYPRDPSKSFIKRVIRSPATTFLDDGRLETTNW